jgi:hypothetical protein
MNGSSLAPPSLSFLRLLALAAALAGCGGGDSGRPVVIPVVPAGAFEAGCQQLCTLAAGETVCTAKHAEFCLASCRARTRDLPQACGDCVIAAGTPISGYVDNSPPPTAYCTVGGPASLQTCATMCDDAGAAAPSPDLDVLCQLECSFYMMQKAPVACSMDAAMDCLTACRSAIAAQPRICAQCLAEGTNHGVICFNSDCDCLNSWQTFGCDSLCDTMPPM